MFLLKRGLLDTVVYTALMDSNKNLINFKSNWYSMNVSRNYYIEKKDQGPLFCLLIFQ